MSSGEHTPCEALKPLLWLYPDPELADCRDVADSIFDMKVKTTYFLTPLYLR